MLGSLKSKQRIKSFLIPTEAGKTMKAVSGLCTLLYGGASYSVLSTLGANSQVLTVSDQIAFDRLLSPEAVITVYRLSLAPTLKSATSVLGLQRLEDLPLHFRPALQTLQWRYLP